VSDLLAGFREAGWQAVVYCGGPHDGQLEMRPSLVDVEVFGDCVVGGERAVRQVGTYRVQRYPNDGEPMHDDEGHVRLLWCQGQWIDCRD
jgi:hypothetical protein